MRLRYRIRRVVDSSRFRTCEVCGTHLAETHIQVCDEFTGLPTAPWTGRPGLIGHELCLRSARRGRATEEVSFDIFRHAYDVHEVAP